MPGTLCEGCGAEPGGYNLFDYCAECSRNLCPKCMKQGCCGMVPVRSGMDEDYGEEQQDEV